MMGLAKFREIQQKPAIRSDRREGTQMDHDEEAMNGQSSGNEQSGGIRKLDRPYSRAAGIIFYDLMETCRSGTRPTFEYME